MDKENVFARITAAIANVLGVGSDDDGDSGNTADAEPDDNTTSDGSTTVNVYVGGPADEGDHDNHSGQEEDGDMERAELIDLLVNSECCEASREELEETPDNILRLLAKRVGPSGDEADDATDTDVVTNDDTTEGDEDTSEGEGVEAVDAAPALSADVISALNDLGPDGITSLMTNLDEAKASEAKEREELIGRLTANKRCQMTKEQLEGVPSLNSLRALERSFSEKDFTGVGGSRTQVANESTGDWHSDGIRIVPGPAPKE